MGLLAAEFGRTTWLVSRLDLYLDVQGWDLAVADRERFVCRSQKVTTFEDGERLTGFVFGSGKTLLARLYDKTAKIAGDGSDWWREVWGRRYVPGWPVWRVEFELRRKPLDELGIREPLEALEEASATWGYLTQQWLSHRTPTRDQTRSRWPVSSGWVDVQSAFEANVTVPAERIRSAARSGSLRLILPSVRGYVAKVGALRGERDLDGAVGSLREWLVWDELESGIPFDLRIAEKRRGLGLGLA